MKVLVLISVFVCGCAPSYWVLDGDLHAARAGTVSTVPAIPDSGGDPLHLKAESLAEARPEERDGRGVRVTPRHTRLKVGWALLGIGTALAVTGLIAGITPARNCTGDEECWLPQLIAGSTLGGIGGVSTLVGAILAGTSLHEAESRY